MDLGRLRRHADLLGAAPSERADVAVRKLVGLDDVAADLVDLGGGIGHLEVEHLGAFDQPQRMLRQLEDFAPVGAQALEYRTAVMESVRQDVDIPLAPGNHLAIEPDKAVTIVKGSWPGHAFSLRRLSRQDRYLGWLDDEPAGGQRCW